MAEFEKVKKAAAELDGTSDKTKVDKVNELHYALEKGKEEALTDIKGDIEKAYPNNTDRQNEEKKVVETTLGRLETQYKNRSTENIEDFTQETDEYFDDLRQLVGQDAAPAQRTIDAAKPETFWNNANGWYEEAPTVDQSTDKKKAFEEEVVEGLATPWKEQIHTFQGTNNRIKTEDGGVEKFQNWLKENKAALRKIILRQIGEGEYIVDFSNISKNIDASLKENSKEADFIAKNIGLADLLEEIDQKVSVSGKDGISTGTLNSGFKRSNGLIGGYLTKEGKYLTIWHGAVINTKTAQTLDEIIDEEEPENAPENAPENTTGTLLIVNMSNNGSVIAETRMKYNPVEIPDTLSDADKAKRTERMQQTVETRRRTLESTSAPEALKGEYTVKCKYWAPQQGAASELMPVEREVTFKSTQSSGSLDYKDPSQEYSYTSTQSEYSNVEIAVPLNSERMFLLKAKRQPSPSSPRTLVLYETDSLAQLNKRLEEEVENQDYSTTSSQNMVDGEVDTIEFEASCSKETIDRYIRLIKDKYPKVKKIVIRGDSYSKTIELMAEGSTEALKFQNSDITEEGLAALKTKEETTSLESNNNGFIKKRALAKLRKSLPKLNNVKITAAKNLERDALLEVASIPSLADLSLSYSAFNAEEIAYLGRSTSLRTLSLDNTTVTDRALELMIVNGENTNLINLTRLSLSRTQITDKGLAYVGRLENLEELDLSGNKKITYKGIGYLTGGPQGKGLKKLKKLNLSGTGVDTAALMHLPSFESLESLDLSNTNIDAKAIEAIADNLAALSSLKTLNLQGTRFSQEEFEKFLIELKNTQIDKITGPNGKEYTQADIVSLSTTSPKAQEETQEIKDKKLFDKKIAYIKGLVETIAPELTTSNEKMEPVATPRKYYADITKSGIKTRYRIIGFPDSNIFKIVSPENRYVDIDSYTEATWKDKAEAAIKNINQKIADAEQAAKEAGEKKAAEEVAKKAAEEEKKAQEAMDARMAHITSTLNKTLKEINVSLSIDKESMQIREGTKPENKERKFVIFNILHNNTNIGSIDHWLDDSKDGKNYKENSGESTIYETLADAESHTEQEGEGRKEKVKNLVLKYAKEHVDEATKQIEEQLENARKLLLKEYPMSDPIEVSLKLEEKSIDISEENGNPYVKYAIHLTSQRFNGVSTVAKNNEKIGYIDNWIGVEPGFWIYDKENSYITPEEGASTEETLKKLIKEAV